MYPSQTSLIPATVSLARFFEENGFSAFNHLYPYWYLGSTPFRYLIGPVAPVMLTALNKLFPTATLFTITIYIVLFSLLLSAAGWGLFSYALSKDKRLGLVVGLLTIILPWRYLSSLAMDEASLVLARNFVPFALLAVWSFLKATSWKSTLWALLATTFLLLINTSILPIFLVGVTSLALARAFKEGKVRNLSKHIKRSFFLVSGSLLLATLWYTPGYWLTILANPSIGGASGIKVIFRVFDLLKALLPLGLAVLAVYFSRQIKTRLTLFGLTWTLTFLFLTLFRFIGDPDFWTDWIAWFYELEIGLILFVVEPFENLFKGLKFQKATYISFLLLLIMPFLALFIYEKLGKPTLISNRTPEGIKSLEKLSQIAKDKRVFLSGSTVFWANALHDIYQVRGGRDQVARHPHWDKAAYELREGTNPELSRMWLEKLGVSYVLVHTKSSKEFYHDFRNIEKWDGLGDIVWQEDGDILYRSIQENSAIYGGDAPYHSVWD